jgi:hypothetical protein
VLPSNTFTKLTLTNHPINRRYTVLRSYQRRKTEHRNRFGPSVRHLCGRANEVRLPLRVWLTDAGNQSASPSLHTAVRRAIRPAYRKMGKANISTDVRKIPMGGLDCVRLTTVPKLAVVLPRCCTPNPERNGKRSGVELLNLTSYFLNKATFRRAE